MTEDAVNIIINIIFIIIIIRNQCKNFKTEYCAIYWRM